MQILKRFFFIFFFTLFYGIVWCQIPTGYYTNATGLTGENLRTALKTIISTGHVKLPYTSTSFDVWNAYQYTDVRPTATTTIWDMYSDRPSSTPAYTYTLFTSQCGNASAEGNCYSREHCFPKSWWGGVDNATNPQYTDLHHLFPADQFVNLKKSNYPIGKVNPTAVSWTSTNGSKVGNCGVSGYTGLVFEPIDEYKGDFARAYLYIITRYKDQISTWLAGNSATQIADIITGNQYKPWFLNMLIEWSINDPVSAKEITRNDAIYYQTPQHNRNPFVDHPEYVTAIWGTPLTVSAPVVVSASAVNSTSFTANWNVVSNATDGYLLDVSIVPNFANVFNQTTTDLLFSEYVEGSASNRYIEIYNGTGNAVNLSNYQLKLFVNGATTATTTTTLSGTLANGSTIVYKNASATIYTGTATSSSSVNFTGNDAIALFKISTNSYVDIFGRIGEDPITAWTSGGFTTLDKTLIRMPSVTSGVTANPASGFPTLGTQWIVSDVDDVTDLGSHTFANTYTVDNFLSGYQSKPISGQATTSAIVTGIQANTIYYYRLRAKNGTTISSYSNTIGTPCTSLVTPTFAPIAAVCPGSVLNPIPTTSTNGIVGTWSPALNNTVTTNYTFTPTAGQCATSTTLTIPITCASTINLTLFIQGYYIGNSTMNSVKFNQDITAPFNQLTNEVEDLTVELHSSVDYSLVASTVATLKTDGSMVCNFPTSPIGSFYIVVKGNNILQNWSATPQTVGTTPLNYNFSSGVTQSYTDGSQNPMTQVDPGVWAFYQGDFNGDDTIDLSDASIISVASDNSTFGALPTDVTGDGSVDLSDVSIVSENSDNSRYAQYPF